MIVALSGIDNCGKSTQLELLDRTLSGKGFRVRRVWGRVGYTSGMEAAKSAIRRVFGSRLPPSGKNPRRQAALRVPLVRRIWLHAAILDMYREYVVEARLRRVLGEALVYDRFTLDSEVDLALAFPDEPVADWLSWRLFRKLCVKPDAWLYLDVPLEVSRTRARTKAEAFPDDDATAAVRYGLYARVRNRYGVVVLDATQPAEALHRRILEEASSRGT